MITGAELIFAIIGLFVFWWLYNKITEKYGDMEVIIFVTIVGSLAYGASLYLF